VHACPGTSHELDPVKAAWDIGAMVRWLDYNGHLARGGNGATLPTISAHTCRGGLPEPLPRGRRQSCSVQCATVLTAMIKAQRDTGPCWRWRTASNRVGLDHVVLVKVASAAVVTRLLGGAKRR